MNFDFSIPGGSAGVSSVSPDLSPNMMLGGYRSGFDGANTSTKRGRVAWHTMDTRKELDQFSRNELIRRIRWLHANMGFVKGVIENASMLVGWLTPTAMTDDPAWNKLADENFSARAMSKIIFDRSGKFNFKTAQMMLVRAAMKDGDILTVLTETPNEGARVMFYEGHQLATMRIDTDKGYRDGVRYDKANRHISYSIASDGEAKYVSARDSIYFGRCQAVGNVRAHPPLAHAVNHAIDVTEVWGNTKHGIKSASLFGLVIEESENAPKSGSKGGMEVNLGTPTTQTSASGEEFTTDQVWSSGQVADPGRGRKISTINDNRPGPDQRKFTVDLFRDISNGLGLPLEVLGHMESLKGPGVRLILDKAEKWIEERRLELKEWCTRYWVYHMAKEIKAGRLPMPDDANWIHGVEWTPQRSLSIDRGRDGKQRLDEIDAGYGTLADWCIDSDGANWRKNTKQRIEEVKFGYEQCGGVWEELSAAERHAKVFRARQGAANVADVESKKTKNSQNKGEE